MKMRSVMSHAFSMVPSAEIPRSSFDRSHGYKTTFDAGLLIPIFIDEALPGDTFNLDMTAFARLATPVFPVMDNIFLDSFFFFVPYRLLWDNWERFNGAQDDPDDSIDFTIPTTASLAGGPVQEGTLWDYFGLPMLPDIEVSCLPFRAYRLIWNTWFRDENLQDSETVSTGNGPDAGYSAVFPLRRGKRHDYFTSCLPWPQKGDAVSIPLGTSAPVVSDGTGVPKFIVGAEVGARSLQTAATTVIVHSGAAGPAGPNLLSWSDAELKADLTVATAATINQLRQAFQVQRLLERDARGGTRYTEIIRAHFGVVSPDARLQRPEYLGGGSTPVNITPVPQTSGSETEGVVDSPQGNLAAYGTALMRNHSFTKSFTEHGVIIGLVMARADLTYQQGVNRMWSRSTRFDFYWPALSHIGEQAVLSKEIFADGSAGDEDVFGYQERYAEYRYKPSVITSLFRSSATASLDSWHLSQEFTVRPELDETFIVEDPPIDRVIAVSGQPHFLFDSYFSLRCARPMPVFGVPGMIDHF